jgi:hypothetical protein
MMHALVQRLLKQKDQKNTPIQYSQTLGAHATDAGSADFALAHEA